MKKKMVWLGMAAAALLAAGGSAFAQEGGTKEVTDVLDRTITLPEDVEKVVVTFNLEEYLAVTGEEGIDKLVGFSHDYWKGRREDAWKTYVTKFPQIQELPDVGYNDTISVESIISLDPDVVLMSAPVNYDYIEPELDKFAEAGIEVAFVNYHKQTVEMHRSSTELIGEIMGQEERAKEISDFYEDQVELIRAYTKQRNIATFLTLHDLNMAARYADRLILLHDGGIYCSGEPKEVLTERHIRETYGIYAQVQVDADGIPLIYPVSSVQKQAYCFERR